MRTRSIAFAATALSVAWCGIGTGWADDAADKAELQKQLGEMRKEIDELKKKQSDGVNRADDELEQRVGELEKLTKKDQDGLFTYWKQGLKFDSVDGAFKLAIFGRAQVDFTFWDNDMDTNQNALGKTYNSTEWRRVRLGMSGTIYKNVEFKAEFDFADQGNGTAAFTDVFMQLNQAFGQPVNVRVGHFDEPFGLDRVTSSKYTTFTERSLVEQTFAPARNTGVMVFGQAAENHVAWFLGAFRDSNVYGNDVSPIHPGQHALTARLTGRPWINEDGTQWVHLGAAISRRTLMNRTQQFRARPEVHVGPRFIDTGAMANMTNATEFDIEAAANMGPLHAQFEYAKAMLEGGPQKVSGKAAPFTFTPGSPDRDFDAWSFQVGYFLTGENREYDVPMARWNRIKVKKNFGDGHGAWEIAARVSNADLNDGGTTGTTIKEVQGGEMRDYTVGINWYLNPNTKVMFDWVHFIPDREVTVGTGATAKKYDLKSGNAFVVSFRIDF